MLGKGYERGKGECRKIIRQKENKVYCCIHSYILMVMTRKQEWEVFFFLLFIRGKYVNELKMISFDYLCHENANWNP